MDLQQRENCENSNDPDLVQAFLNIFWNKIGKIVVKAVPNPVKQMLKKFFLTNDSLCKGQ
jgi:hypothetical protein